MVIKVSMALPIIQDLPYGYSVQTTDYPYESYVLLHREYRVRSTEYDTPVVCIYVHTEYRFSILRMYVHMICVYKSDK